MVVTAVSRILFAFFSVCRGRADVTCSGHMTFGAINMASAAAFSFPPLPSRFARISDDLKRVVCFNRVQTAAGRKIARKTAQRDETIDTAPLPRQADGWDDGNSPAFFLSKRRRKFFLCGISFVCVCFETNANARIYLPSKVSDRNVAGRVSGRNAPSNVPRYIDSVLSMPYAEEGGDGRPSLTRRVPVRRFTGDDVSGVVPNARPVPLHGRWPASVPFKEEDFFRADQQDDGSFYAVPRYVDSVDEPGAVSMVNYFRMILRELKKDLKKRAGGSLNNGVKIDVLDLCAGWVSHFPREWVSDGNGGGGVGDDVGRIAGLGMNRFELAANAQLTDWVQYNINNEAPTLPYNFPGASSSAVIRKNLLPFPDNSFDLITISFSIEYIVDPISLLRDLRRVLRKRGRVIIITNDRCFPNKATAIWLSTDNEEHLNLINA
uniref:Methyltransferase type 11 domain-containing protein n=1 Tax=Corethron hystrix TaxID=216773 RepID=A0A6U5L915_9STRA|mmetsp:Transcript_4467/g.8691  ORF Transcript_4467/g.8691 Transcript_4467/m.8691 type:complete len:435 (+) Transcript_4467:63-1367(+)